MELADEEFSDLKKKLAAYQEKVPDSISREPNQVFIDAESIRALLREEKYLADLDRRVAQDAKAPFNDAPDPSELRGETQRLSNYLQLAGLETIAEVIEATRTYEAELVELAKKVFALPDSEPDDDEGEITPGISLFYLAYFLIAMRGSLDEMDDFLKESGIGFPDGEPERKGFGQFLIEAVRDISGG